MTSIAVDYTPAVRQQAGIGRIVRGQINALIDHHPELDLRLFVVGRLSSADRAAAPSALHGTTLDERNMVRLWHRLGIPWPAVERYAGGPLDLFHATDFVLAPNRARRAIVTVHDLAFLHYPDAAHPSLYRYLNVVVPRSIRRADHIVADSHHTAHDVMHHFGLPPERVTVVQGGVDHKAFKRVSDAARLRQVLAKYGVDDRPYVFSLSSLQPRKNFARLIEAYAKAKQDARIDHALVIGGGKGWLYDDIFKRVCELDLGQDVMLVGYVDDADLPVLYSGAAFFAYPSLYEGFGLPIVEALACGTPVLAANNSCLPEAGGPGALYVDAEDTGSIAGGIMRLATDTRLAAQLASAGAAHAAHFTWDRSAEQLMDTYRRVLDT